jgi:hydroxyacylglutathione hydrolase
MILETIVVGPMQVNCYILASSKGSPAIIIDPGDEIRKIKQILDREKLKPALVINTHGHYDHIGCDDKFSVPVYIHKEDFALLKDPQLNLSGVFSGGYSVKSEIRQLSEGQILKANGLELKVLHIPGHTPGGISLLLEKPSDKILFTGDSLFFQGIGRSDLAGGDEALLVKSIKDKLFILSDDTIVYPGHGPSSTIGEEKKNNPFLS